MSFFVDTHCHLQGSHFPEGPEAVLGRAGEAGVKLFLQIGVGVGEGEAGPREAVALAERRSDVLASVGVHPHDAATLDDSSFAEIEALAQRERVVAIGETGLDYHYDHAPRDVQQEAFRRFVALARAVSKPLVIHTRSAPEDTLRILEEERAREVGGVIHCFSEDWAFAERALDLGFYVSFSGIVTFKSAKAIQEVAARAPSDRVLLETDSPDLAPIPLRGRTCEPAYLVHTAGQVAKLRGVSIDELAAQTTENARRLFCRQPGQPGQPGERGSTLLWTHEGP